MATLNCYSPHAAWQRLREALVQIFPSVGGNVRLAHDLFQLLRRAGLENVNYRPFLVGSARAIPCRTTCRRRLNLCALGLWRRA